MRLIDFSDATPTRLPPFLHRDRHPDEYTSLFPEPDAVGQRADVVAAALLLCDLVCGHKAFRRRRAAQFHGAVQETLRRSPSLMQAAYAAPGYASARAFHEALEDAIRVERWPPGPPAVSRFVEVLLEG